MIDTAGRDYGTTPCPVCGGLGWIRTPNRAYGTGILFLWYPCFCQLRLAEQWTTWRLLSVR